MKPSCYCLILVSLLATLSACSTTDEISSDTNPGDRSDTLAETNVKLGVGYLQQGRSDLALTKLQRALELNPNLPGAHNAIAIVYDRLGELDKAEQHYLKAINLAPKDSNAHNNYGTFLCKRNELDKAEKQFLQALENPLYETPALAYENAGLCALRVPNTIKAEKYFRSALQIDPRLPGSLYQMGVISFDRGDNLSARAYLQRYTAVARHTPQSLWLGVRVERVLGDKNAVSSYALQLRSSFPDSGEARLLGESEGRAVSLPKSEPTSEQ
ncbi:MAG: type IV pilus biogenesis/stability protein PilW [Gammaproteobacteria bacterium]